jgi:hypothetical protein
MSLRRISTVRQNLVWRAAKPKCKAAAALTKIAVCEQIRRQPREPTRSYFRTITATVRLTCSPRRLVHPLVQAAGSLLCLVLVCLLLPVAVAMANDQTTEELAKESENPITRRIAIPAESNTSFVVRPGDGVQETLKLKPVIPFALDDGWNLITRTIAPITFQPRKGAQQPAAFSLGDVNPTFYVSPPSRRHLILGFGPSLVMPTATSSALGAAKWSLGPAAAISYTPGKWLFGALVSNVWSLAGGLGRPAVDQFNAAALSILLSGGRLVGVDVAYDLGQLAGAKRTTLDGSSRRRR